MKYQGSLRRRKDKNLGEFWGLLFGEGRLEISQNVLCHIILKNLINEEKVKNEQVMMNTNEESQEPEANMTDIKVLTLFVQFGAPFLWPEAHGQGSIWAPPREREQLQ